MAIDTPLSSGTTTPVPVASVGATSTIAESERTLATMTPTSEKTHMINGARSDEDVAALEKIPLYAAQERAKAGWWNCQFNLTNAAIGAGLVCLPKQFQENGYLLGIALMVFVGVLSGMSQKVLAVSGAWTGRKTFRGLSKEVLGPFGEVLYVALVFLLLLGPMTAYFNLSANYIKTVVLGIDPSLDGSWFLNKWFLTGALGLLIKFPLSLIQPISKLAKVSTLALLIIVYTIFLVIVRGVLNVKTMSDHHTLPNYNMASFSMKLLDAVAVIGFSYANHFIYLEITSEMKQPTNRRQTSLIVSSNTFITLVYVVVALTGYLGFTGAFSSDVLTAMKGIDVDICKLAFAMMMCLSYPLVLSPARDNLTWLIHYMFQPQKLQKSEIRAKVAKTTGGNIIVTSFRRIFPESFLFYALTVGLLLITYVLSNSFANVNDVLAVFFSLAGGLLVFVFPSLYWLMLATRMPILQQRASHEGVWQSSKRLNFFQRCCMPRQFDVPKGELSGFEMEDKEDLQARATFPVNKPVLYTVSATVNILFGLFLTIAGTYCSLKTVIEG